MPGPDHCLNNASLLYAYRTAELEVNYWSRKCVDVSCAFLGVAKEHLDKWSHRRDTLRMLVEKRMNGDNG